MIVTPEEQQRISLELAKRWNQSIDTALEQTVEEGFMIWSVQPPAKRLQGYMLSTLAEDFPLVITSDYLDLFRAGILPSLKALEEWQAITATGQSPTSYQRYLWPMLLLLPDWVFRKYQSDFIHLVKMEMKKEPQDVVELAP